MSWVHIHPDKSVQESVEVSVLEKTLTYKPLEDIIAFSNQDGDHVSVEVNVNLSSFLMK